MTTEPHWQTTVFGLCAGLAFALQVTVDPDLTQQLMLLAPLVAILGLPHGALDLPIAEALWPLAGWRGKLCFAAIYLGLALGVIAVWVLVPGVALVAFLIYSALHFSDDWSLAPSPLRWTGGSATIGAPALMHPGAVETLFGYLAPSGAPAFSTDASMAAGAVALCVFLGTLARRPEARGQAAVEQMLLWTLAAVLPPLVYFAVYFCGLHSIRHFGATIRSVPHARRALCIAAGLSGLVVLTAAITVLGRSGGAPGALVPAGVQVIFIGLASLTVPHMILIARMKRLRPQA